jgi:hypothetical protein
MELGVIASVPIEDLDVLCSRADLGSPKDKEDIRGGSL